tara:strand:- start:6704 stop:7048 length:345 start_codon:yes stop_codon:yes gene_type:complete
MVEDNKQIFAETLLNKYPNRIPVICNRSSNACKDTPPIEKTKYLVARELTMGQFIHIVRKRIQLPPDRALFFFINDCIIPPTSSDMDHLYNEHKSNDKMLYLTYTTENTFGSKP